MLLLRNPYTWSPLYIFLLFKIYKINPSLVLPFFITSICCFAVTDYTSASIIKPYVGRIRPCHVTSFKDHIYILVDCGGRYSFPSSHASNHFGLATLWFCIFQTISKTKWYWLWAWAAAICYAQIYVGKHYPLDILGGALLGITVGKTISIIFQKWFTKKMTSNNH